MSHIDSIKRHCEPRWPWVMWYMSTLCIVLTRRNMRVLLVLLLEDVTWKDITKWDFTKRAVTTLACTLIFVYVCLYICVLLQGAAAVSLCGQPTLLWDVHPDGHYHEQHCSGGRGPRASQCTSQQRESDWHLDFINKHLEVHNKHNGCQMRSHTNGYLHENVHAHTSTWGQTYLIGADSFRLIKAFLTGLDSLSILRNKQQEVAHFMLKCHHTDF